MMSVFFESIFSIAMGADYSFILCEITFLVILFQSYPVCFLTLQYSFAHLSLDCKGCLEDVVDCRCNTKRGFPFL